MSCSAKMHPMGYKYKYMIMEFFSWIVSIVKMYLAPCSVIPHKRIYYSGHKYLTLLDNTALLSFSNGSNYLIHSLRDYFHNHKKKELSISKF